MDVLEGTETGDDGYQTKTRQQRVEEERGREEEQGSRRHDFIAQGRYLVSCRFLCDKLSDNGISLVF